MKLKVIAIGDAAGIVLPPDVLERLKVKAGDTLLLTEALDGYQITRGDPDVERQMALARRIMRERSKALKALGDA